MPVGEGGGGDAGGGGGGGGGGGHRCSSSAFGGVDVPCKAIFVRVPGENYRAVCCLLATSS